MMFCNSPKIHDKHQLEYLCNLKDRTKEESYSIKKYIMASRLEVEQEDVTPDFFVTYKNGEKMQTFWMNENGEKTRPVVD